MAPPFKCKNQDISTIRAFSGIQGVLKVAPITTELKFEGLVL
jgi:hypothetical protein